MPISYEVATLLSLRDQATAPLQRFIALLRETQEQLDIALAGLRKFRNALSPSVAALGRQRESLGLATKEAQVRAGMAAEQAKASDAMLAGNAQSLELAKAQKAVLLQQISAQRGAARSMGVIPAFKRAGSNLMWGGVGILGGLGYATQKAIDFNQTALETDMALGGYTRSPSQRASDIRALQRAAFAGSEATGFFDAQSILEGLKKAASAGARPLVEKMGMGVFTAIAPALSRYMDVLGRLKGESADQAAMEAIQTAHQFGAYTPDAINRILNAQAALALLMPDTMSKAITTGAYVAPFGKTLAGMSDEAILALMATADQSGIGKGRAGARLANFIEAIAVTQSKAREGAKKLLGITGALDPKTGSLDLMKSFDILIGDRKRMGPQAFRDAARTAFGAQGNIIAAMFGDPSKVKMFEANKQVITQSLQRGDLTTIQNLLKGGVAGQEALAWTRLQNDVIQFGQYGLPIALKFFDTINPKLKQFSDWMSAHPDEAKKLFDDIMRVGEAMLALGVAFKVVVGLASAVTIIKGIASALKGLYGVAIGLPGPLKVLAAVLGVIYDDVKEFEKFKNQNFRLTPWDMFREGLGPLGSLLPRDNPFQHSVKAASPHVSHGASGSWGAAHASAGPVVHVGAVNITIKDATDPKAVAKAIADWFSNPMHTLSAATGSTHSNIPVPFSVRPA
jgi:hypothetical protein